jgi:HlyD family secretion protein
VRIAEAKLLQSKSSLESAELRCRRMTIRTPMAGRILGLVARPGTRLNGLTASSLQDSSTVVTMYDPSRLQVRVDVRLDDVGKVLSGQKTRIESAALPGKALEGEVLTATSQADMQKNTLSVKVAISNPPATLKPDMLCQVTFLAPPRPAATPGGEPHRMLIPRSLVLSSDSPSVWVADRLTGRARLCALKLGLTAGELVEVVSGLSASDKLIVAGRDGLRDGDRVRVIGEDDSLGISSSSGKGK